MSCKKKEKYNHVYKNVCCIQNAIVQAEVSSSKWAIGLRLWDSAHLCHWVVHHVGELYCWFHFVCLLTWEVHTPPKEYPSHYSHTYTKCCYDDGSNSSWAQFFTIWGRKQMEALFVCMFGFVRSLPPTRLYHRRVSRLTSDNFTCCHTRDRAGRPWLLSQLVTLYTLTQQAGSHFGDQTQDLLTKSRTLYQLSYRPPPPKWRNRVMFYTKTKKKHTWLQLNVTFDNLGFHVNFTLQNHTQFFCKDIIQ